MKFKKKSLFGVFFSLILGASVLVGCGGGNTPDTPDKPGEFIDYFNDSEIIRLKNDYKKPDGTNRNFYEDGISEVEVYTFIDGDTTHFKMKGYDDADVIQSRYYGVDTPESTGDIQPYGKAASNFTKDKLKAAKTIVVTSESLDYVAPTHDTTGSRYVSMVWISEEANANYKDLRLLNLLLVQEGLSLSKGLLKFPEFEPVFTAAETQARDNKLNMHSGKKDPLFNYGEYETVSLFTIQDCVRDVIEGKTDKNPYDGEKVRINGIVAGFANGIIYLQASRINDETGETEYAGINIFCGMGSVDSMYTEINTELQLCGTCVDSEEFGFQISGVHGGFPFFPPENDKDAVQILKDASEVEKEGRGIKTFELPSTKLNKDFKYVNSPVVVDEVFEVTGADNPNNSSKKGGALFLKGTNGKQPPYSVYISFGYYAEGEPDMWTKATQYVGHKFKFNGIYTVRKTKKGKYVYNILPRSAEDITMIA